MPASAGEVFRAGSREVRVALGYPNAREVAAGNLGFRIVARLLRAIPGIRVQPFFLASNRARTRAAPRIDPLDLRIDPPDLKLASTDLVLFSLAYEGDAPHVPALLAAGGLPEFARQRRPGHPLVVGGGALAMINPEPLAALFDLFLLGEAEAFLTEFLTTWARVRGGRREDVLQELGTLPGAFVPMQRTHRVWSRDASPLRVTAEVALPGGAGEESEQALTPSAAAHVQRIPWSDFGASASWARMGPESDLGDATLVELARGCRRRCRFCAATRIYAPLRECAADVITSAVEGAAGPGDKVGLLGLSAGDYPQLAKLAGCLGELGVRMTISSLPPSFALQSVAERLVQGGARTLTIAPETGSDRLRHLIGKPVGNDAILRTAALLGRAGLRRLRTYFIIGLPQEREGDLRSIGELLGALRRQLPAPCTLSATVNAFVPKPQTPFQWAPMETVHDLKERARILRSAVPRTVRLRVKSFREARQQALIARGDVTWGPRLVRMASEGIGYAAVLRAERLRADALCGAIEVGSPLPWGHLLSEELQRQLAREWQAVNAG